MTLLERFHDDASLWLQVSMLEAHVQTHKENKAHVCPGCGKAFKQVRAHAILHSFLRSFIPSFSQSATVSVTQAFIHPFTHSSLAVHFTRCPFLVTCLTLSSLTLSSLTLTLQANGLRAHVKSCEQKKTYLCEFCPSKFSQLESLRSHVRSHTGQY